MKKKVKAAAILTTAALLAGVPALAYGAGWEQDERGYWYELEDRSYPAGTWMEIDGSWYHFDPCPRRLGGDFCLLTDDEISKSGSHTFDHSLYPPTP